jgi:hypothetical protein
MNLQEEIDRIVADAKAAIATAIQNQLAVAFSGAVSVTPKGKTPRAPRRTGADVTEMVGRVIAYIQAAGETGIGAGDIKENLGLDNGTWLSAIKVAMSQGVKKSGEKRSTRYYYAEPKPRTARKSRVLVVDESMNGAAPEVSA